MPTPLTVAEVGTVIRSYRKASGVSQKELARLSGISRATLNYLESGREDLEIGAGKLFALLGVLGVPLNLPAGVERASDERLLGEALGGYGEPPMAEGVLMEAMASGKVPAGADDALASFLSEAPPGVGLAAVRLAATRSGNPAKEILKKARGLAKALHLEDTWASSSPS